MTYIHTVSDVFVGFHVRSSYLIEFKYQASQNPLANAGDIRDTGSIPGSGRSPGGGHVNPGESHAQRSQSIGSQRVRYN